MLWREEEERRSTRHAGGINARLGNHNVGIGGFYEWSKSSDARKRK
jgi:hypothetical protein